MVFQRTNSLWVVTKKVDWHCSESHRGYLVERSLKVSKIRVSKEQTDLRFHCLEFLERAKELNPIVHHSFSFINFFIYIFTSFSKN